MQRFLLGGCFDSEWTWLVTPSYRESVGARTQKQDTTSAAILIVLPGSVIKWIISQQPLYAVHDATIAWEFTQRT
jgi:hypothetical protein